MNLRLYLRAGGKLRRFSGDAGGIAHAFAALPRGGAVTLAALGSGGDGLYLRRDGAGRFRFSVVSLSGPEAMGRRLSARRDFGADAARHLLELYVADDPAWRTRIAWKRGLLDLPVAILAPATILICVIGYFAVAGATGGLKGWSWRYLPNLAVGLLLVGAVFAYIDWFFRRLRRRLADALGRVFGLRIVEAEKLGIFTRPGTWESAESGLVSELKVTALDLVVLLLGLLVPVFAIGTAIVLAALPILA